jgi:hypothetical protein
MPTAAQAGFEYQGKGNYAQSVYPYVNPVPIDPAKKDQEFGLWNATSSSFTVYVVPSV